MKKIMFVCTGNICRSAMAEKMLMKMLIECGKEKEYLIYSSGVFAYEGQAATQKAIEAAAEKNVDLTKHRAKNVTDIDTYDMDLILCMTGAHKLQVRHRFPKLFDKVYTLKEYVVYDNGDNKDIDIQDPYGFEIETYRKCINEIESCLKKLLDILR